MLDERWFVSFRGHTLGPLTSEQVKASVRKKELGPHDKILSSKNSQWVELNQIPEFNSGWEMIKRPEIPLPPPPSILRQRKKPVVRAQEISPAPKKRKKAKKKKAPTPAPQVIPQNAMALDEEAKLLLESFRDWKNSAVAPEKISVQEAPRDLEIRLPVHKFLLFLILTGILLATVTVGILFRANKTRDPEGIIPPDPPASIEPLPKKDDPIPSLKAPTRPNRDS